MLKTLTTMARSLAFGVGAHAEDRNAIAILAQQTRDAASAVRSAQRAVALIRAQREQEEQRAAKSMAMIADLEERAGAALDQDEIRLATEAAEAIAVLEDEHRAARTAQDKLDQDIERLTNTARQAQARLRELQRGQRVVNARDQVQRVGKRVSAGGEGALTEAEAMLAKIEERQNHLDLTDAAYAQLTVSDNPNTIVERLAEAGCGPTMTTSAETVLARLKDRHAAKSSRQTDPSPAANAAAPAPAA